MLEPYFFVLLVPGIPLVLFTYYLLYNLCQCCYHRVFSNCLVCVPYPKVHIVRLHNEPSDIYIQYQLLHITSPYPKYHIIDTRLMTHSQIYSRLQSAFYNQRSQIVLLGYFTKVEEYEIWKQLSLRRDYSYVVSVINGNDDQ